MIQDVSKIKEISSVRMEPKYAPSPLSTILVINQLDAQILVL